MGSAPPPKFPPASSSSPTRRRRIIRAVSTASARRDFYCRLIGWRAGRSICLRQKLHSPENKCLPGKSRRANFQVDGERFSLSSEERAGVRTVVSTNFVFWGRNGKTDLCFTLALTCVLSPPSSLRFDAIAPKPKATADGERILAITVSVV